MRKLSVIYNICGISKKEDFLQYVKVLNSLKNQNFDDYNIVVSGCMVEDNVLNLLKNTYPDILVVNVKDVVPVNVSFNATVKTINKTVGPSEGYLYLDYGVSLNKEDNLQNLYNLFKSGPYSMVSTQTENDNGYHLWFGLGKFHGDESENYKLFENGDFVVPVGKCVNLHAQIFSHELYEAYGKVIPDIFAAYCTESVLSFLNAAIKRQWIISKDIILPHTELAYNCASGFGNGVNGLDRPFGFNYSILDRIAPGVPHGMGYDESRGLVMHNTSCFDDNGFCTNDDLKQYIKDYIFLSNEEFNYDELEICMI